MVLDTGATTSVLYTLRVQQLDRGPQLLSTAQAQGTAAGPFSSSQPARRVECDLAVRGVVGPVRWILAPGGSNEPPGVVGLLGSDWLHAAGSAAAVTFDWRHGLCRIAMDGGSSTWDIPLVTPRAAEGDGVRCVVEIPTTAAATIGATDTPPWTLNEGGAPRCSVLWKKSGLREDLPEEDVPVVALEEFLSKRRSDRVEARHQDRLLQPTQ